MHSRRSYYTLLSFLSFAVAANGNAISCGSSAKTSAVVSGSDYAVVWEDNFDNLCSENWFLQTQIPTLNGWFNGELQHYTDRTDNAFVDNGILNIVAQKETYSDLNRLGQSIQKAYTSARLNSKFAFTYGRVDVRARVPGGSGVWPAIWMLGQNTAEPGGFWYNAATAVPWPYSGELDIMEHFGNNNAEIVSSLHTPTSFGTTTLKGSSTVSDFDTEFHVYSMVWEETEIKFMVDGGEPVFTYKPSVRNSQTWPFDKPHYLLLNVAVGGPSGPVDALFTKATMEIDYVKVSQRESVPPQAPPAPLVNKDLVTSLFSDSYVDEAVDTWVTGWSWAFLSSPDITIEGNSFKKYTELQFVAIETLNSPLDVSDMTHFRFDLWTPDATEFRVKLVDIGVDQNVTDATDNAEFEVTFSVVQDVWETHMIPLSSFTNVPMTNIGQLFFSVPSGNVTAYIDNVLFVQEESEPSVAAPLPTRDAADVISLFSDHYSEFTSSVWGTTGSVSGSDDIVIQGDDNVKKYFDLSYVIIEPSININATLMTGIHLDLWTPDATTFRIKLVDFGTNGVFELEGTDNTEGEVPFYLPPTGSWIGLDVPFSLFLQLRARDNLKQLILSAVPVAAATVYIDNVYFYQELPTVAAPTPTEDKDSVISLFSDAYSNIGVDGFRLDWPITTVFHEVDIAGDNTIRYSELDFVGVQPTSPIDASAMSHVSFDLWTPDCFIFRLKLVDLGTSTEHEIVYSDVVLGEWNSISTSLSSFTSLATLNIGQIIFSTNQGLCTAYIDNIRLISMDGPAVPAPANVQSAANVLSIYSDFYTSGVSNVVWLEWWSGYGDPVELANVTVDSDNILKYSGLSFAALSLASSPIDVSEMSHVRVDFWTPDCDIFRFKLVDFGPNGVYDDGSSGCAIDDSEHEIVIDNPPLSEWVTLDLLLSDFTSLYSTENIAQIFFSTPDNTRGTFCTAYIDNLYFYKTDAPTVAAPTPVHPESDVLSLYSDEYYTDTNIDWMKFFGLDVTYQLDDIEGVATHKYSNLNFAGAQVVSGTVDASSYTYLHVDIWTSNAVEVLVKLVDFGTITRDQSESEVPIPNIDHGNWTSVDIPLMDFINLTGMDKIGQIIFSGKRPGEFTLYVGNVYFHSSTTRARRRGLGQQGEAVSGQTLESSRPRQQISAGNLGLRGGSSSNAIH